MADSITNGHPIVYHAGRHTHRLHIHLNEQAVAAQEARIQRILNDPAAYFAEARQRARELVERDMKREAKRA